MTAKKIGIGDIIEVGPKRLLGEVYKVTPTRVQFWSITMYRLGFSKRLRWAKLVDAKVASAALKQKWKTADAKNNELAVAMRDAYVASEPDEQRARTTQAVVKGYASSL